MQTWPFDSASQCRNSFKTCAFLAVFCSMLYLSDATAQQIGVTPLKTCFQVNPAFNDEIAQQIKVIREQIKIQREGGKLIAYISTPLSGKGGGNRDVNVEISHFMKRKIEKRFADRVWALDPAVFDLAPIGGQFASGSEYMFMWTTVLAGDDGMGRDFSLFVVTGPSDVREYFSAKAPLVESDMFGGLEKWIDLRSAVNPEFRKLMAQENVQKRFLHYYGLKASSSYSLGAHDEWNIFVEVNRRIRERQDLGIPEQIPIIFDGRSVSVAEMEASVSAGSALACFASK